MEQQNDSIVTTTVTPNPTNGVASSSIPSDNLSEVKSTEAPQTIQGVRAVGDSVEPKETQCNYCEETYLDFHDHMQAKHPDIETKQSLHQHRITDEEAVAIAQAVTKQPAIQGQIVEEKPKAVMGRPSKYNEGMLKIARDYLALCKVQNKLPLLEELARLCDVHGETLENWCSENDDFFETIKKIKSLQKERIIMRGFGKGNPTFAIFMLKANHGMMETEKQVLVADRDVKVSITRE